MNGIVLVFYYCIGKKTAHSGVVKKSRTEHFCSIRLGTGVFEELPTDQELVNFNHHPTFNPIEDDKLKAIANQNMREKVFEIEKSGVLNSLDIKKFVTYAQLADLDVTVKDGKINIPKNKDSLKRFLSLLCERLLLWKSSKQNLSEHREALCKIKAIR